MRLLLIALLLPTVSYLGLRIYKTYLNYQIARQIGLPIIILPISWQDDLWLLCVDHLKWLNQVPWFKSWFDFSRYFWTQDLRHRPHHKYGNAFSLVAAGGIEIMVSDPQAVIDIQSKYKGWDKPEPVFQLFDTFGRNVLSANGDDWQRHRRIINPAFQEPTHKLVWAEGRRQAQQMLNGWLENGGSTLVEGISKDCILLALHVLSAAGFGQNQDFNNAVTEVPSGHSSSLSDTLTYLLNNPIAVLMFSGVTLPDWILPQQLRTIKQCVIDFKLYMREAIAYSRGLLQGGSAQQQAPEITTMMIKANETAKREQKASASHAAAKPMYLSDDEVLGNLYIFNIAGFETTANALTYSIPYLAAHPNIQDWVMEEIDRVRHGSQDGDVLKYEETFPQLIRCIAVMYETLRLWPPASDSCRWANGESQTVTINGRETVIPKGVFVTTNNYGVMSDPRWWGENSLEWNPKRWVMVDPESNKEKIAPPPAAAAYVAWGLGPRICPGKKFSQVEFAVAMSSILSKHRLEPLVMESKGMKTKEDGRKALLASIWASGNKITPKIGRQTEAGIVLVPK